MNPGAHIHTSRLIRSQKTGAYLPRDGTYLSAIANIGRTLILVHFENGAEEYLFPDEIEDNELTLS